MTAAKHVDPKQQIVQALAESVQRGSRSMHAVPGLLRRVIEENLWQKRILSQGDESEIALEDFNEFVTLPYAQGGIGTSVSYLRALCFEEPDLIEFLDQVAMVKTPELKRHGKNQHTQSGLDNVKSTSESGGNSAEYALARLKRDNPELAEKVITGELSAHRAAIIAGIRKERISVPNHDMRLAARALVAKLEVEQLEELVMLIQNALYEADQ